jgi:hypothetical protein
MTFEIIAMICALGQSPTECVPQTSRSHWTLGTEANELGCMRQAQMSDAKISLAASPGEYIKFMCVKR